MSTRPAPADGPPIGLVAAVVAVTAAIVALLAYLGTRGADEGAADGGGTDDELAGSASALPGGAGISAAGEPRDGAPVVQVYEDFQCPGCGRLEARSGEALAEAAEAGEIRLTYTLMSFLDGALGNDSSSRAANAALCADDQGAFTAYHGEVFAAQPAEEGRGWTDEQLLGFAEAAAVPDLDAFGSCAAEGTYLDYVAAMQERAAADGVSATPTVLIDGEPITDGELGALMEDPEALDGVLEAHS